MIINNITTLIKESNEILNLSIDDFLNYLNTKIDYGFIDKNNKIYKEVNEEYEKKYLLQTKDRLASTKIGQCWDFVELERYYFNQLKIKNESYFICDDGPHITHTLLIYFLNGEICYIESAWFKNKGIYKFKSKQEFWDYFLPLYSKSNGNVSLQYYLYKEPSYPMTGDEFVNYCINK
jgi:hypothetical protein